MKQYLVFILMIPLIQFCDCEFEHLGGGKVLSRKRRYLNFPTGSTAVVQISMSTGIMWELTNSPLPRWNSVMAWDLGFKLPNNSRLAFGGRPRRDGEVYALHRKERRELYKSIEGILDSYGYDGHACLLRTLCETRKHLKPGRSLVEDLLHVIFTIPYGEGDEFEADGYDKPASNSFCRSLGIRCPFSLLEYLLS